MPHTFLVGGQVNTNDLKEIIRLTINGKLVWFHSDTATAFSAIPSVREALESEEISRVFVGEDIRGIRIGYNPDTRLWHYLRMTNHAGEDFYVEQPTTQVFEELVSKIFDCAVASDAGLLDLIDREAVEEFLARIS